NLAMIASRDGRKKEAAEALKEVLKIRRKVLQTSGGDGTRQPAHTDRLRHLAYTLNLLGVLSLELGELRAAADAITEAQEIRAALVTSEGTALDLKDDLVLSRLAVVELHRRQGDPVACLAETVQQAVEEAADLCKHEPRTPEHERHLAQALLARGQVRMEAGN